MLAPIYQLHQPCRYQVLRSYKAIISGRRYHWQKSSSSSLLYNRLQQPQLLQQAQQISQYYYLNNQLQRQLCRHRNGQPIEERRYLYNQQQQLEQCLLLRPGKRAKISNYSYNSQGQLQRQQDAGEQRLYHYNRQGQLRRLDLYQGELLYLYYHYHYQNGQLQLWQECMPNGKFKCQHYYRYNRQTWLQSYSKVSGQNLVLERLRFSYPIIYGADWLERHSYRLQGQQQQGQPLLLLRRRLSLPANHHQS